MITTQVGYRADSFPTDFFPTVSQIPPLRAHTHTCAGIQDPNTPAKQGLCVPSFVKGGSAAGEGEIEKKHAKKSHYSNFPCILLSLSFEPQGISPGFTFLSYHSMMRPTSQLRPVTLSFSQRGRIGDKMVLRAREYLLRRGKGRRQMGFI